MMDSSQGREVCLPTHWPEEFCFSVKQTPKTITKLEPTDTTSNKKVEGPIPVNDLNIKPRDEGRLRAIAPSTTAGEDFKDLRTNDSESLKFSIQEENSGCHDNYQSQCVVSGTSYAVKSLLNNLDNLLPGNHGIFTHPDLKASACGQYREGLEFSVLKQLGKGGFGEVDLCRNRSGKEYVRKQIHGKFKRKEVEVLMTLRHENITGMFGYIWRDGTHEILMEYGGMSLKVLVETGDSWREVLSENAVMQLALQGLSALQYMHSLSVLHLDIKPDNVCITYNSDSNLMMKLTDFGTSLTPEQAVTHDGWTPEYMSPEACQTCVISQRPDLSSIFKNYELTGKSDVFSFGLVLYFMLEGSNAVLDIWKDQLDPKTFASFRLNFITYLAQSPNYVRESVLLKERPLNKLLKVTLAGDPEERPSAEEVKIFVLLEMLADQLTFPNLSPPGSPQSDDMQVDRATPASILIVETPAALLTTEILMKPETPSETQVTPELLMTPAPLKTSETPMTWTEKQQDEPRPGGGKDIKNCLRQKLLRKQASSPYNVDPARKLTSGQRSKSTEMSEVEMFLPVFSALLDD